MLQIRQFNQFHRKILLTRKHLFDFVSWPKAFWAKTGKNNFLSCGVGTRD